VRTHRLTNEATSDDRPGSSVAPGVATFEWMRGRVVMALSFVLVACSNSMVSSPDANTRDATSEKPTPCIPSCPADQLCIAGRCFVAVVDSGRDDIVGRMDGDDVGGESLDADREVGVFTDSALPLDAAVDDFSEVATVDGADVEDAAGCAPGTTRSCYTGQPMTRGIGRCHGGLQVCDPVSRSWSAECVGEVTPTSELCNGLDDDCNDRIDDDIPDLACGIGACRRTATACTMGRLGTCIPGAPMLETCNAIDDDCDANIDNGFDLATEAHNCGTCGHVCAAACVVGTCASVASLALGYDHACALLAGTVRCWGRSDYFGPGLGMSTTPVPIPGLMGVLQITAGNNHTCAILADRSVSCWGQNSFGQLGDGTTDRRTSPTSVPHLTGVAAISAGSIHTCALRTDGTVWCWGYNPLGTLGDGTTLDRLSPVIVPGLTEVVELSAGNRHTCVRLRTGAIECWGDNAYGQLGRSTMGICSESGVSHTCAPTPDPVPGLTDVVELSARGNHSCVRTRIGAIQCWGLNSLGQLGRDTGTCRVGTQDIPCGPSPAPVGSLANAAQVVNRDGHTCVRLTDGALQCWGSNSYGGLGDGTTMRRTTPSSVISISTATQLAVGVEFSCAVLVDGGLRCWGWNQNGKIGDGTTVNRTVPTSVIW
jgi:alpha-tubulin suppressor-like RCC1 family protein